MNVLALTIFVGFVLVSFFTLLWLLTAFDSRQFSESEALLPLESEANDLPISMKTNS